MFRTRIGSIRPNIERVRSIAIRGLRIASEADSAPALILANNFAAVRIKGGMTSDAARPIASKGRVVSVTAVVSVVPVVWAIAVVSAAPVAWVVPAARVV